MSPLMVNEEGQIKAFKVRSRWNMDYDYGSYVAAQILDDVRGVKYAVHLVLTLEHGRVREIMPDWWCYGEREYITVVIGKLMSEFLRKYRAWRKQQGLENNFIAWFLEFHEKSGYPHIHCMFLGKYIAPLAKIHEMWGLCDFNGVRLGGEKGGKRYISGYTIVGYLTRYVTKEIDKMLCHKDRRKIAAMMWYFKRRLYNVRHYKRGKGIPGDVKISKWSLYISEGKKKIAIRIDEFIEKLEKEKRENIYWTG